jgi:hypothetical protein
MVSATAEDDDSTPPTSLDEDSTDNATLEDDSVNATTLEDVTSFAELEIDSGTGAVEKLDEEAGMAAIEDTGTFKVVSGMTEAFSSVQATNANADTNATANIFKFFINEHPL